MAKRKKGPSSTATGQPKRVKLSAAESLKRMEEVPERKEANSLPLSEKARIEVYLPDLPSPEYQDLLEVFEQEICTYTFGGCMIDPRPWRVTYLTRLGVRMRDRIEPHLYGYPVCLRGELRPALSDTSMRCATPHSRPSMRRPSWSSMYPVYHAG